MGFWVINLKKGAFVEQLNVFFTTPVGRLVSGSIYTGTGSDRFKDNAPYLYNSGANAGKQKFKQWFSIAVKKGSEKSWKETEWGLKIFNIAKARFDKIVGSPAFSWKIDDGDSEIPNSRGRCLKEKEGYAGNWILNFSNWSPTLESTYNITNAQGRPLENDVIVEPGDFIRVYCSASPNKGGEKPGIYLSQKIISFVKTGPRIVFSSVNPEEIFKDYIETKESVFESY
jgi:hypothetical protein